MLHWRLNKMVFIVESSLFCVNLRKLLMEVIKTKNGEIGSITEDCVESEHYSWNDMRNCGDYTTSTNSPKEGKPEISESEEKMSRSEQCFSSCSPWNSNLAEWDKVRVRLEFSDRNRSDIFKQLVPPFRMNALFVINAIQTQRDA